MSGEYVIRGCLVDRVPQEITRADIDTPRLPDRRLTPREPVEMTPWRHLAVKLKG